MIIRFAGFVLMREVVFEGNKADKFHEGFIRGSEQERKITNKIVSNLLHENTAMKRELGRLPVAE